VKALNLFTKTDYENFLAKKEEFKEMMPLLRGLDKEEFRTLNHLLKNKKTEDSEILEQIMSNKNEKMLAKISEEENFAAKNRYRL
jgi:hypothetical protein